MSYKNLRNFGSIINRKDFDYVSDLTRINQIIEIILYRLTVPDGKESYYIKLIKEYLENLESFYSWINGDNITYLKEGYYFCQQELARMANILIMPETELYKRRGISKGYLRKFNKLFLYGLSMVLKGIREAFTPALVSSTGIDQKQLAKYMIDEVEGIGTKFLFNTNGKYAAAKKLNGLTKQELIVAERLLSELIHARTTKTGWIDLGEKRLPVRILLVNNKKLGIFGRDIVAFIFRVGEHHDYEKQLKMHPDKSSFSAA